MTDKHTFTILSHVGEAGFLALAHHGWFGLWVWLVVICYLWPLAGSSCNPDSRQPTRPAARDTLQEHRWGRGQGAIWETQLYAFAGLTEIGVGNSRGLVLDCTVTGYRWWGCSGDHYGSDKLGSFSSLWCDTGTDYFSPTVTVKWPLRVYLSR